MFGALDHLQREAFKLSAEPLDALVFFGRARFVGQFLFGYGLQEKQRVLETLVRIRQLLGQQVATLQPLARLE